MMSARSGTIPFILVQLRTLFDQCAELFFCEPLALAQARPARELFALSPIAQP